jgi:hypothetical protein
MKAKDKISEYFRNVAGFWSGFFDGQFYGERCYNTILPFSSFNPKWDIYDPIPGLPYRFLNDPTTMSMISSQSHVFETRPNAFPLGFPNNRPLKGRKFGYPLPKYSPAANDRDKPWTEAFPNTTPENEEKPPKPPKAPKQHRPDCENLLKISLELDFMVPVKINETLLFTLRTKPYMDRKHDERLYIYTFFVNNKQFRFCLGRAGVWFFFDNDPTPKPFFLLTSITERVEYFGNERTFVIFFGIRDIKGKKRRFRAVEKEREGVIEALKFFFDLRFYETWEEYDEMRDLCPALNVKARDLRDQLRRDLCEAGMKLI